MKRFIKVFLPISILSVALLYSCIDDQFDTPPINELPVGSVLTIQDLKELCPIGNVHKFYGDTSLYAIVTMDEKSGNIYKNAYIQDATGAVNLRFQSSSALYEGDSIRLYLKGAKLSWYNNTFFQIDSLHPDSSVVKQATNRDLEPEIAPLAEISNYALVKDYWQSKLVKLENVQFVSSDTSKTYANPVTLDYGELYLEDEDGNTVMVRTSGYAKFAGEKVPNGSGSVVAIVGLYRETVQLYIRRASEVELDNPRVGPFFIENFTKDLGSFSRYNILGTQAWKWTDYDDGCAVMSGFEGGNFANEDWLVSPAIDLTGRNNVVMNIKEAINYINPATGLNDMQILVSSDYQGGDPTASGTWTALSGFNRPAGNNWTFVESGNIDMSAYDGETIYVAFKYISNSTKAASWEVTKVQLEEVVEK
ncbi:MAG TPA: DUF5689 domain-containing protein [Tenuifilaceae bacterium]|nr:DUF5689 domain-containing protein [Tenuifilaceae bacterium]HPE18458.1 DUF5689 domain-containing protein [Tenuifilaceae bacterium]HPJ46446.1 DUF5689 domain-containing protein [Tenuifilaceae bacterium]HRX69520.1 DUF5689 domain-containing protein [Tenuifilaceae bacterium]